MGRMRMFPVLGVPMGGASDNDAPVPVITTEATEPVSAAFDIAIAFTNGPGGDPEDVTGFTIGDLTVTNGAASNFAGSGASYTATITPDWAGPASIVVPAGAAVDGAGNENPESAALAVEISIVGYLLSLSSPLILDMETLNAGKLKNLGTSGAALDATMSNITLNASGALYNGTTSYISVPYAAAIDPAAWTYGFRVTAADAGEGSVANLFAWGNGGHRAFLNGALSAIRTLADGNNVDADSITSAGLGVGTDTWVFITFNNAGERKLRVYTALPAGVRAELPYSSGPIAMTDTINSMSALVLFLGNRLSNDHTWNGSFRYVFIVPSILSEAAMNAIAGF